MDRGALRLSGGALRLSLALLGAAASVSPALAATGSGSATAVTVRPLSLVKTEDLDFGTIARGTAPGVVTINADTGVRTVTGGVIPAGGTPRRAEFVGVAPFGILTLVAISAAPTLTNGSGGTMASTLVVQGGTGLRIFPGTGVQVFRVGGAVSVGANQAEGIYTGTFTLTVNYL